MIPDKMKNHILAEFATGFVSHFEYDTPEAWGSVTNYSPLTSTVGGQKLRAAMRKQVLEGRMIGGIGWTSRHVRDFFGGANFYGIPCGAVMKDSDPLGRIVHDYGYHPSNS